MTNELVTTEDGELIESTIPDVSLAIGLTRAEIDSQVATARAYPRSIQKAISNITTLATLDEETAAECIYALPRGGKTIRGPSIRFAEIVAAQWGNSRIGARVVHVDRTEAYVESEAIFHDLETNVAQAARIRRTIQAKRGKGIDSDMIQLAGAAASSIARRNAILAGVPKGIYRKAYLAVEQVIRGDISTLAERRNGAMKAFMAIGVTPEQVFAALGVKGLEDITLDHLATLTGMKSALKNGEATVEEMFSGKPGAGPTHEVVKNPLSDKAPEPEKADAAQPSDASPPAEAPPPPAAPDDADDIINDAQAPEHGPFFAAGQKAARAGSSRKAMPAELRAPGRESDAAEWIKGYDGVHA